MQTRAVPMAELTIRAVVLGLILSVVMGAANVYLGLKVGLTVSASIPAAVIAMLVLRVLFRGGTILEANQVQTAASAGESLAAGIIFTMPALLLIGVWTEFNMVLTAVVAFTGGLLGILFMIPMRRVFITSNNEELRFPEGVACAAVLEAGQADEDPRDAMSVVKGAAVGGIFKIVTDYFHLFKHNLEVATSAGGRVFYFGSDISPALVAVGFIVRLNVSLLIFVGGAMAWLVGLPLLGGATDGADAVAQANTLWATKIRYVGVGAMVVGGISSIFKVRTGLVEAVQQLTKRRSAGAGAAVDPRDRDIPGPAIVLFSTLATVLVAGTYYVLTDSIAITLATTVIMIVMSFFFTAVASYIVGLVGNSNSPVSGMTITAVLFTGLMLLVLGFTGVQGMVATLGVAAIVCCAACTSGDVCNDLKTGHMVGAAPFRQQIMQILGVGVASLVMAPVMQVLHEGTPGGIGGPKLAAPQASLFASLAKGFFADGNIPKEMVAIGAGVGVLILIVDYFLGRKGSAFRLHLMPVAVGMYLPFGLAVPILLGGLIAHLIGAGTQGAEADKRMGRGVLFASGLIAGESLLGVLIAVLVWKELTLPALGLSNGVLTALTLAAAAVVLALFWKQSQPKEG